jgi:hypothetical protein
MRLSVFIIIYPSTIKGRIEAQWSFCSTTAGLLIHNALQLLPVYEELMSV